MTAILDVSIMADNIRTFDLQEHIVYQVERSRRPLIVVRFCIYIGFSVSYKRIHADPSTVVGVQ